MDAMNDTETKTLTEDRYLLQNPTVEEEELFAKVNNFSDYFDDMIFAEDSITRKFIACQVEVEPDEYVDDIVPIPDELRYFSYSFFFYHVSEMGPQYAGSFNSQNFSLTVSPSSLDDDVVILHEMIHLHEFALGRLPSFYRDIVFYSLYCDLQQKIDDLDALIKDSCHILNLSNLQAKGGTHDLLFILKSFDLDLRMEYPLGTILRYKL